MENKERLISIFNEDKQFYIYFKGTTHYDEDNFGRPIERENFDYLDENFNRFILNGSFDTVREFRITELKKGNTRLFIGPKSPETENADGKYVPNTRPDLYGLWEKASKEDLLKYQRILEQQNKERMQTRVFK